LQEVAREGKMLKIVARAIGGGNRGFLKRAALNKPRGGGEGKKRKKRFRHQSHPATIVGKKGRVKGTEKKRSL